jgi:hypothetical protein
MGGSGRGAPRWRRKGSNFRRQGTSSVKQGKRPGSTGVGRASPFAGEGVERRLVVLAPVKTAELRQEMTLVTIKRR